MLSDMRLRPSDFPLGQTAQVGGCGKRCLENVRIGAAAANIATHRPFDFVEACIWIAVKRSGDRHNHPRRAETALQGIIFDERMLNRMHPGTSAEPFNRGDSMSARICDENHA